MVKLAVASPFVKVKCNFLADSGTQTFSLLLLFSSNEVLQLNLFLKGTLFFGEKGTSFLLGRMVDGAKIGCCLPQCLRPLLWFHLSEAFCIHDIRQ